MVNLSTCTRPFLFFPLKETEDEARMAQMLHSVCNTLHKLKYLENNTLHQVVLRTALSPSSSFSSNTDNPILVSVCSTYRDINL